MSNVYVIIIHFSANARLSSLTCLRGLIVRGESPSSGTLGGAQKSAGQCSGRMGRSSTRPEEPRLQGKRVKSSKGVNSSTLPCGPCAEPPHFVAGVEGCGGIAAGGGVAGSIVRGRAVAGRPAVLR